MVATFIGFINVTIEFSGLLKVTDYSRKAIYDATLGIIGIVLITGFLIIPILKWWFSRRTGDFNKTIRKM